MLNISFQSVFLSSSHPPPQKNFNSRTDCDHLKVLQFLQHFSLILICDASAAVDSATLLPPCPDESSPLHPRSYPHRFC